MGAGTALSTSRRLRAAAAVGAAMLLACILQVTDAPTARAGARPDLVVRAVEAPRSVAAGARLRVKVTVANKGAARASRSSVRLYLSYGDDLSNGSVGLGKVRLRSLKAHESRTLTVRRRVPTTAPLESFVVVACADPGRQVAEKNEANNCRSASRAVTVTRPLDAYAKIDNAVESGDISAERGLIYKVYADAGDPALPKRFGSIPGGFDGGSALAEAAATFDQLGLAAQRELAPYFAPPAYGGTMPAASARQAAASDCAFRKDPPIDEATYDTIDTEHFRFWYYTVPLDASLNAPPATSRAAAEQLAQIAENVYDKQTELWRAPLSDVGLPCSGGDGRIDFYLIRKHVTLPAQVIPYPRGGVRNAGWAYIRPDTENLRAVFTHEFAHLVQIAYNHPASPSPSTEYAWLQEASANWAVDYVYPSNNFEHDYHAYVSKQGHTRPLGECGSGGACADSGYHDWIYFYFLTRHLGDPQVMARIWDLTETKSSMQAVDQALGGDFGALFSEFALRGLNRENYRDFSTWDGFKRGIAFGPAAIPFMDVELGNQTEASWPLPGSDFDGRRVLARSYKTDQYDFSDPDIMEVELRDFGYRQDPGHPDVRIKAWYKLADGSRVTEDWTDRDKVVFCRDEPGEDIQKLVLFYVHGEPSEYLSTRSLQFPKETGKLTVKKECEPAELPGLWTGTANGTNSYGSITETWNATVVLSKQSWSTEHFTSYGAVPGTGTWTWTISGTTNCPGGGSRSISGSFSREFWPTSPYDPSTTPRGEQLVLYGPDAGPLYGHSNAFHVNLNPATPEPLFNVVTLGACAGTDSEVVRSYTAMNCVRDADSDYLPYTPEMTTIAGSRSYDIDVGCGDSNPVTATWNLTASD